MSTNFQGNLCGVQCEYLGEGGGTFLPFLAHLGRNLTWAIQGRVIATPCSVLGTVSKLCGYLCMKEIHTCM